MLPADGCVTARAKAVATAASKRTGESLASALNELRNLPLVHEIRGHGLMQAIELRHPDGSPAGDLGIKLVQALLKEGILLMPEAPEGHVLAFTPPIGLTGEEIAFSIDTLSRLSEFAN